jgi:hypothetical protein
LAVTAARFLSNLFLLLAWLDVQGAVRGRDARELSAHVGDQYVRLKVETLATLRSRKRAAETKSERMAIEVEGARGQHGEREERLFWSDGEDGKLEDRLPEIGVAIVLTGERKYRKAVQSSYDWDRRSFDEKIERARKAREEAAQRAREAPAGRTRPGRAAARPGQRTVAGAADLRVCGRRPFLTGCR